MNRNKVIDDHQFGFRSNHSTYHPLMITKDFIQTELRKKNEVVVVSLDLRKAFDTCVHDTLQDKILYYLRDKNITSWFDSYFSKRHQFTSWNGKNSKTLDNYKLSVVQGSALGPHLFNIYINDLSTNSESLTVLFADDSNFIFSCKNAAELNKVVNHDLQNIKQYLDSNGLSINTEKTTYLHYVPKNRKKTQLHLEIGNKAIKEVESLRFLGVFLDNRLSFKTHFNHILNKIQHGLRGLIMTKNLLTYRAKLNVYQSLIHSHMAYCSLIWLDTLNAKQMKQLKTIQKKCMRIIFNSKYNTHTDRFFQFTKVCKIENLFQKEALQLTYKYHNNALPQAIQNLFDKSIHKPSTLTRNIKACALHPKPELKPGHMMYNIIDHWNRIGYNIRNEKYYKDFKNRIIDSQNQFQECEKINCYSCNYDYNNLLRIIRN